MKRSHLAAITGACSLVVGLTLPADAVTKKTWTGQGTTDNWSDGNNWSPVGAPANVGSNSPPQSELYFDGSTRTAPVQNFALGFNLLAMYFNSGAAPFVVSGSAIGFGDSPTGYFVTNSTNPQVIRNDGTLAPIETYIGTPFLGNNPITFGTSITFYNLAGTGGLRVDAANQGIVTIATATYTGTTTVNHGTLRIGGNETPFSSTFLPGMTSGQDDYVIDSPATLSGAGTIGLAPGKRVTLSGRLTPGVGALPPDTADITIDGDLVIAAGGACEFWAYPPSPSFPNVSSHITVTGLLDLSAMDAVLRFDVWDHQTSGTSAVIDYGSRLGKFDEIQNFNAPGLGFTVRYTSLPGDGPGQVIVTAPEPGSTALWLACTSVIGARRWTRG